jgi:hypothetical protein
MVPVATASSPSADTLTSGGTSQTIRSGTKSSTTSSTVGRDSPVTAPTSAWAQAGTCPHTNHHRHSEEGAAFPPGLKAGVSTPRN